MSCVKKLHSKLIKLLFYPKKGHPCLQSVDAPPRRPVASFFFKHSDTDTHSRNTSWYRRGIP